MTIWTDISRSANSGITEYETWPEGGQTILIRDPDSDLIPFAVREASLSLHDANMREVNCVHLFYELADGPVRTYDRINETPGDAITRAVVGTRWEAGDIDASLVAVTKDVNLPYANPLEFLRYIEREFDARLKFRVEVSDTAITAYKVDLLEIDEEFKGQRFELGHNLRGINIALNYGLEPGTKVCTALVGLALYDPIDLDTDEPEYMTFADVEWTVAGGDPADKPLTQEWVGDEEARLLYGIYDPTSGDMLHRYDTHESQALTPETLLTATWTVLQRRNRPRVYVNASVADLEQAKIVDIATGELVQLSHEKIRLGNVCHVIAREKGLFAAVEAKVNRIVRYPKEPERTHVELGDSIVLGADVFRDLDAKLIARDKQRRLLDRGRGGQTVTIASEDTSLAPYYANVVIPSGTTNILPYIAEAIALLPSGGGTIVFQDGLYTLDRTAEITMDNVSIKGQGEGTVFKLKDGVDANAYCFYASNKTGISVSNVAIDGNRANQTSGVNYGIYLVDCEDSEIRSSVIKDLRTSGIAVESSQKVIIEGNTCEDSLSHGISVLLSEECLISLNNCEQSGEGIDGSGISIVRSSYNTITGNVCNSNKDYGIWLVGGSVGDLDDCAYNIITDNACSDNRLTGIYCAGYAGGGIFQHNTLSDNMCNGNGWGISVTGHHNSINGNECDGNYDSAVTLVGYGIFITAGSTYNNVQGNKCYNNNDYGIRVALTATDNIVTNNDLYGNTSGGLLDEDPSTVTTAGNRS